MKTALSIAGYDPSSGAGVTADLMVFAAHGDFGISATTALTVQSTAGVEACHPVAPEVLNATLECLGADLPPAGIKIGMLATAENTAVVCRFLERLRSSSGRTVPVVLDPVLRSSSGRDLLTAAGLELMRERLLPLVDWVTPNVDELGLLSGKRVRARSDLPAAARELVAVAGRARLGLFATGGHLDPPDDYVLSAAGDETWLPGERVETRATHGTGCVLSSAFLCGLIAGKHPADAAREAKEFVVGAMRHAILLGSGRGPLNFFWRGVHP